MSSRAKAFKLVKHDKKLVRFFLPLVPKNPDDADELDRFPKEAKETDAVLKTILARIGA